MRPFLSKEISLKDFKNHYWLKSELINFCKLIDVNYSGGKIEISKRIETYLKTGEIITEVKKNSSNSKFDWKKESLSSTTIITDNYSNTQNVRKYFQSVIGSSFKFNIQFINWMKCNVGKTLGDAITAWKQIELEKRSGKAKSEIAPQFEYNTYIRDFLNDNPNCKLKDAQKCWTVKKSIAGSKKYLKSDREFLK